MKRRALSMVLALFMVLSLLPVSAFAAVERDTSASAITLIKHFEGFSKYPYWDYSQYTVGYGTRCPSDMLSYYRRYGITEAAAEALLIKQLNGFESEVNRMNETYDLDLQQHEFDALVMFTYNVGPGWIYNEDSGIAKAVKDGATSDDFLFAFIQWCKAGGNLSEGLIKRRLVEARLYLEGVYSTKVPEHYGYVTFDHTDVICGGERTTVSIQGYDAAKTAAVRPVAVRSGYRFLGWYTAASGGKWVSHLDSSTNGLKLYARWQYGNGNVSGGVIQGTAASYERDAARTLDVRANPSDSAAVSYTLPAGTRISVVADYVDADGVKWGRLAEGGWVKLSDTDPVLDPAEVVVDDALIVTVTTDRMNVRSGPGTQYSRVRYAYRGEQMELTEVKNVSGTPWGQFTDGWICLDYTDYVPQPEKVIATGRVAENTDRLNIRAGAGTGYGIVGALARGDEVEIYEFKTAGGTEWGRISKGWICMDYVILDEPAEEPTEEETTEEPTEAPTEEPTEAPTEEPTEAPTEAPTEEPTEAPTEEPTEAPTEAPTEEPTEAPTEPPVEEDKGDKVIATGTINITSGSLNVRAGAGSGFSIVGSLKKGAKVEIYEYATADGTRWARIANGWVSMNYVKLDPAAPEENKGQTGTVVVSTTGLNVRSGPGFSYAIVTKVANGARVTVTETQVVGSMTWGHIAQGWVSMDYIKLDSTTEPPKDEGGKDEGGKDEDVKVEETPVVTDGTRTGIVVNCTSLNVRSGAGTGYSKVGSVKSGTKVTVTELKMVGGTVWGHIAQGWVSLDYVKLDEVTAGSLSVVTNSYVNIRSGADTSYSKVGTYSVGDVLIILETKKVGNTVWGKTARGWISLDYAL